MTTSPAEARTIAKDAYIYGYPMVQTYLTMYAFSIDKPNPQYKVPSTHRSVSPASSLPTILRLPLPTRTLHTRS
jgi:hypothetical protein